MYYTGIDPVTKQQVYVARNLRDRNLQRALLQFFKAQTTSKFARRCNNPAARTWLAATATR